MKSEKNNLKELVSLLDDLLNIKSIKLDNELIFEEEKFKLSISIVELEQINEKIHDLKYYDIYIFNKHYFEELLNVEGQAYYVLDYFSRQFTINNENKLIKYELSVPSLEYIILSYMKMCEVGIFNAPSLFLNKFYKGREYPNGYCSSYINTKFKSLKFHKTLVDIEISTDFEKIKIDEELRNFIESQFNGIITLKIISNNKEISNENFSDLADAFRFWINYHTQIAFIKRFEYIENSLESIKRINNIEEIDCVPQRLYNKELLLYYELALSSNDPVLRFLSFYHILEYFFNKYAKLKHERKQIKSVMKKFLNEEELKKNIAEFDFSSYNYKFATDKVNSAEAKLIKVYNRFSCCDYYNYLTTEKVNFASAEPLDDKNFISSLGNRIYDVRNAIVHRKEDKNIHKYLNYKIEDEQELKLELPLIRLIAEQIIIKYSNNLELN